VPSRNGAGYSFDYRFVFGPAWLRRPTLALYRLVDLEVELAWWLVERGFIRCDVGGHISFRNLTPFASRELARRQATREAAA
jgi:hypothetical protein